ncbi:hypothetical protein IWW43_005616, partial [Coemansia sp. RSA 1935]
RLRRDSPARNNRSEEHSGAHTPKRSREELPGAHTPKRSREELPGSSTLEPPRQRLTTSSAVESRTKSPVEAGPMPAAKMSSEEVDRKRKELRAHWHQKPSPSTEIAVGVAQAEDKVKKTPDNATTTFKAADKDKMVADKDKMVADKDKMVADKAKTATDRDTRQRDQIIQGGRRAKHGDHPIAGPQADQRLHAERGTHRPNWVNSANGPGAQQGLRGGRHSLPEDAPFNRGSGGRQNRQDGGKPGPAGRKGQGQGQGDGGRRGPKRGWGAEARDWDDGKRHRR